MAIPARGRTSVLPRVAVENSERLSVWGEAGYGAGEPTLTPAARGGVTIRLPATAHCAAEGAVCTNGGREVSEALSVTVFRTGLTARFEKVPEEHDGSAFTFDFRFSEAPQGPSYKTMRGSFFHVTNATIEKANRLVQTLSRGDHQRGRLCRTTSRRVRATRSYAPEAPQGGRGDPVRFIRAALSHTVRDNAVTIKPAVAALGGRYWGRFPLPRAQPTTAQP